MAIVQRKDNQQHIVETEVLTKLELDKQNLQTKEMVVGEDEEVSSKELLIAGLIILVVAGLMFWMVTRK